MNSQSVTFAVALAVTAGLALAGPLNPPAGAVSASMKTLAEIEPRTAINTTSTPPGPTSTFRITQPGSYYLTGNLSGSAAKDSVIEIACDNVTIDLKGFTVTGGGAQYGFRTGLFKNISIRDGFVQSCGTNNFSLDTAAGTRLEKISSSNAGETSIGVGPGSVLVECQVMGSGTQGIVAGEGSVLSNCSVRSAGDAGIIVNRSSVHNCSVSGAGGYGFTLGQNSTAIGCSATGCATGFGSGASARIINCGAENCSDDGILAGYLTIVDGCTANGNGQDGIEAFDSVVVRNCSVYGNGLHGINANARCTITANSCVSNGSTVGTTGAGVYVAGVDNRIEGNTLLNNEWGLRINAAGNIAVKNMASGNGVVNYTCVAGNAWGPVVNATTSVAFSGNSFASVLGSTDPNANYSY